MPRSSTADMQYVFKGRYHPVLSPDYTATRIEINRPKGKPVGGLFQMVEGTGKFVPGRLRVTLHETSESAYIEDSAAGVKTRLRRLREQERAELQAIDEEFERLHERRKVALAKAWARGNVVTLAEVKARLRGGY